MAEKDNNEKKSMKLGQIFNGHGHTLLHTTSGTSTT